ncbi:MAG: hypothetical protein LKI93_02710 [Bifidobacteriaceae bacterium]|nr:hypothetical protein [Bifidobacteriaceae bacterium]MCI1914196.1 hypothetical protein [Bifidobacteriaceae bacterium]
MNSSNPVAISTRSAPSTLSGPVRIAIFGDGWRTRFFCRVAAVLPDRLRVELVIGKHDDNIDRIRREYGVAVTKNANDLGKYDVDFVCAVVSWPATPGLVEQLVGEGYKVYCETPPAPDLPGLRELWTQLGSRAADVQVGEQYYRMPGHSARLAILRKGTIGDVNSVHVASTHLYHAIALIRDYMGVGRTRVKVTARSFGTHMVNPMQPDGWVKDPQIEELSTMISTIDFGEGRYGLYDFVDNQWWNPLLSRRIVARGTLGEMVDDTVLRWHDGDPITSQIEYRRSGRDMNLEGNDVLTATFDGEVVYRNPFIGSRLSEDDLAVADHLVAMGRYVRGEGPEVYSLADGIHDHAISLAIEESARTGEDVSVAGEAWMDAE